MWHLIRSLLPTVSLLLKFVLNQVGCSHFWIFSVSVNGEGGTAEIKEASVGAKGNDWERKAAKESGGQQLTVSMPTCGHLDPRLRECLKEYSQRATYIFWRLGAWNLPSFPQNCWS